MSFFVSETLDNFLTLDRQTDRQTVASSRHTGDAACPLASRDATHKCSQENYVDFLLARTVVLLIAYS